MSETVSDILNDVCSAFCNEYCKWPGQYTEDQEEELYKHCNECPLNRIGV